MSLKYRRYLSFSLDMRWPPPLPSGKKSWCFLPSSTLAEDFFVTDTISLSAPSWAFLDSAPAVESLLLSASTRVIPISPDFLTELEGSAAVGGAGGTAAVAGGRPLQPDQLGGLLLSLLLLLVLNVLKSSSKGRTKGFLLPLLPLPPLVFVFALGAVAAFWMPGMLGGGGGVTSDLSRGSVGSLIRSPAVEDVTLPEDETPLPFSNAAAAAAAWGWCDPWGGGKSGGGIIGL